MNITWRRNERGVPHGHLTAIVYEADDRHVRAFGVRAWVGAFGLNVSFAIGRRDLHISVRI